VFSTNKRSLNIPGDSNFQGLLGRLPCRNPRCSFRLRAHTIRVWKPSCKNDPSVKRDHLGNPDPVAGGPLRLHIPGWMTGDDMEQDIVGTGEKRSLETASKATAMNQADRDRVIAELDQGFSRLAPIRDNPEDIYDVLPDAAVTQLGDVAGPVSGMAILKGISKKVAGSEEKAKASGLDRTDSPKVKRAKAEDTGAADPKPAPEDDGISDMRIVRNRLFTKQKTMLQTETKKVKTAIEECVKVLNESCELDNKDFFTTAHERCKALAMFLGNTLAEDGVTEDGVPKMTLADLNFKAIIKEAPVTAPESTPGATAGTAAAADSKGAGEKQVANRQTDGQRHTFLLREYLQSLALLPLPHIDTFKSSTEIAENQQAIMLATTSMQTTAAEEAWEEQKKMIQQLVLSTNTAKRDLKRECTAFRTSNAKKEEEQKAAQLTRQKEEEAKLVLASKKQLQAKLEAEVFSLDWRSCGAMPIYTTAQLKEATTKIAVGNCSFPWVLRGDPEFENFLKLEAFANWKTKFEGQVGEDRVQAKTAPGHKVDACSNLLGSIVAKASLLVDGPLPSLKTAVTQSHFFGFVPTDVCFSYEPLYLGSARLIASGAMKVCIASPTSVAQWLPDKTAMQNMDRYKHVVDNPLLQVPIFMKHINQERIPKFSEPRSY
jgi:hypothetical protein